MSFRLAIVIVNFRTPALVQECVCSIAAQIDPQRDIIIIVDNASKDDSADLIERFIQEQGWSDRARVIRSAVNGGFAAGNNIGIRATDARHYLLLNSDTLVREGAIDELLAAAESRPDAGLIGPRLEWPDGRVQDSCFRYRTLRSELVRAAGTGFITRLSGGGELAMPCGEQPREGEWISFACVLIRREVLHQIGLLDDEYFMYFEDIDFCRRARDAGWGVLCWPAARVVHLRGGTSEVKSSSVARQRLPRYYYESRSRFFRSCYGRPGLWLANLLWTCGWMISKLRSIIERRPHHLCEREGRDNWTDAWRRLPLRRPPGAVADSSCDDLTAASLRGGEV